MPAFSYGPFPGFRPHGPDARSVFVETAAVVLLGWQINKLYDVRCKSKINHVPTSKVKHTKRAERQNRASQGHFARTYG